MYNIQWNIINMDTLLMEVAHTSEDILKIARCVRFHCINSMLRLGLTLGK